MKNTIFKNLLLGMMMVIGLSSCEDRELIMVDKQEAPFLMDLSQDNLVLDENFPDNPALTVKWEPAGFTVPVEAKYKLEISATEAFENPVLLAQTSQSQTYYSFTTKELNEAVKKIGLVPYVQQKMYFKVTSFVGVNDMVQESNVTSLFITPYLASPTYDFTDYYLIGSATAANWDNVANSPNMYPLLKTSEATKYTFTGYFKAGAFKMVKVKGSWDVQLGLGAAPGLLSTAGTSGDIPVPANGYYKLTVDTAALTYTFEPATAPTTATYTSISIIGSVNGNWDTDTQLTQSLTDPHVWTAQNITLTSGEFKFRADNKWDVSWGTNSEFYGVATINGANIPLSAEWNYDVYFNDATGHYSVIPLK